MIKHRMKLIRWVFILFVLFTFTLPVAAQEDCDPEYDPFCEDPFEPIPIDGGAIALLVGGAALGYKALKKKKEKSAD